MSRRALFIGRWQPFHNGHAYIVQQALDAGKHVCIAVRDTPLSDSDPYSMRERIEMISATYSEYGDRVVVIPVPDIESVNIGRKVGYEVVRYDAPDDIEGISATEIRKAMAENDSTWVNKVPAEVAQYLIIARPKGLVVWLCGLSGAGKSTIATGLQKALKNEYALDAVTLDGDVIREGLCRDLGFTKEDRDENIHRVSHAAKLVADTGGIAITACISPYRDAREKAREVVGAQRFVGVYVQASLAECRRRDPKGLYLKVAEGEITGFTGVDDPWEPPHDYLDLDTERFSIEECVAAVLEEMEARGL
jgi:adenylylsulfate kinase